MSLPKFEHSTIIIKIPSLNKEHKFRPFKVKEEKILLMAKESKKYSDIMMSLLQVIRNCLHPREKLDVNALTLYDIEYIFLKLRSESVGNIIPQSYRDNEDGETYNFKIDLKEVEVTFPEGHDNKIKVNDDLTLILKDPVMKESLYNQTTAVDTLIEMVKDCLDSVYSGNELYSFKDYKPEEIDEFIDNMPPSLLEQFETFFKTMPRLHYEIRYRNKNKREQVIVLNSLEDFFTLR